MGVAAIRPHQLRARWYMQAPYKIGLMRTAGVAVVAVAAVVRHYPKVMAKRLEQPVASS